MVVDTHAQVAKFSVALPSSLVTLPHRSSNRLSYHLPLGLKAKVKKIKSSSATDAGHSVPPSSSERRNPLAIFLDVPRTVWRQTLRPLSNFGFGQRSIWEGGVGLFLVSGAILLTLSLAWLRGFQLRSKFRKYLAVFEFAQACGISTGTPVRIRGVTVGNVIRINPSLRCIETVVELEDDKIIVPRNSLVEVNQSGLLMETVIDITPRNPIPVPSAGPLDSECIKEGLILCDKQKMKGHQGVSLDELVGIFTRLGREAEEIGLSNTFALAQRVALVIEEAKPLLLKIQAMAEDVQPLLAELRDSGLLKEVENLTKSLSHATEDLRSVHASIMTPENTALLQKSIYTLILTLKNIESLSSELLGFTGDEATKRNLKVLIKSLSRLL
ncbi:Protein TRIGALACTOSYLDIACYLGLYCEROL 2, chloroplastic [Cucurbita argyrosperma subsp. argyrosperma]|uniref:Protein TRIGALACTOSYLDIACYLGLYCEROL 2, chloroplastic-like n=1 Tax=Cucurbita moschata TaxID=3662 RepID=A0A6J1G9G9_CUCMO|nr:protein TRIGALACTOSYLDIACYLGLYCEROL 2, chloroplastic-like [Cucurbita moschata]XP_022948294.1 protein TRIGALACTOSYLDIACYLGLYCEROL 2, chloroplastic-like [Cucurbita moschata]KAG7036881.1 Protein TRIGALACTOSYLDIACYLGLYCEROL 2, chloroplastic [Cucurbita argyrosperma subsp. argyrosperma]